jgi:hypothetical protein
MNQSNASSKTGKSDTPPSGSANKPGFFVSAGMRLKRALAGGSTDSNHAAPAAPAVAPSQPAAEGEVDVETSVQARARELLQHDRAHIPTQKATDEQTPAAAAVTTGITPPPLPPQRASTSDSAPNTPEPRPRTASVPPPLPKTRSAAPKRAVRDSKTAALRARLGAAKAQLADLQAKRGTSPELAEQAALTSQPPDNTLTPAVADADGSSPDPIRTLTIARLLAGQGYFERSLSIYDELLADRAEGADNQELRAEADKVRARCADKQASSD